MKVFRCLAVLLSISIIMIMQGCGAGSDTSGALTLTAPTSVDNKDGSYSVSTTVSYVPAGGKSAEGVVITTTATDSFGVVTTDKATLTSGSNSVTYTFQVSQYVGSSNRLSIVSSIGDMTASVGITIPKFTFPALAVANPNADFPADANVSAIIPIAFTGGTLPIAYLSSDINIGVTIIPTVGSLSGGGIIEIKLLAANPLGLSTTVTVTLTDSAGAVVPITVTYFK